MKRRRSRATEIIALALVQVAGAAAVAGPGIDWPEVPLPPSSAGEQVTSHMKNNGVDMRASQFATTAPLAEVIEFYKHKWPDHVVNQVGGKTVIGHADGDFMTTISLAPAGAATEGIIGTSKLPREKIEYVMGDGFDKPPGTEVFNDIIYYDTADKSRTLGMTNTLSPFQNYQYYAQRMRGQGWKLQKSRPCSMVSRSCVAMFEKDDGEKIAMTLQRQQAATTQIVVNIE